MSAYAGVPGRAEPQRRREERRCRLNNSASWSGESGLARIRNQNPRSIRDSGVPAPSARYAKQSRPEDKAAVKGAKRQA